MVLENLDTLRELIASRSMEAQKKRDVPATKAAEDVVVDGFVLLEVKDAAAKDVAAKDVVVEDDFILM